jgi:hypothetical protein
VIVGLYVVGLVVAFLLGYGVDRLVLARLIPTPDDYTFGSEPTAYLTQVGAIFLAPLVAWAGSIPIGRALGPWAFGGRGQLVGAVAALAAWLFVGLAAARILVLA